MSHHDGEFFENALMAEGAAESADEDRELAEADMGAGWETLQIEDELHRHAGGGEPPRPPKETAGVGLGARQALNSTAISENGSQ